MTSISLTRSEAFFPGNLITSWSFSLKCFVVNIVLNTGDHSHKTYLLACTVSPLSHSNATSECFQPFLKSFSLPESLTLFILGNICQTIMINLLPDRLSILFLPAVTYIGIFSNWKNNSYL